MPDALGGDGRFSTADRSGRPAHALDGARRERAPLCARAGLALDRAMRLRALQHARDVRHVAGERFGCDERTRRTWLLAAGPRPAEPQS